MPKLHCLPVLRGTQLLLLDLVSLCGTQSSWRAKQPFCCWRVFLTHFLHYKRKACSIGKGLRNLRRKMVKTPLLELEKHGLKIGKHGLKLGYKIKVLFPLVSSCISSQILLHFL
jgi:hypothetical protein